MDVPKSVRFHWESDYAIGVLHLAGLVHEDLKTFLMNNVPQSKKKSKYVLGVADPKLGAAIQETLEISCTSGKLIQESHSYIIWSLVAIVVLLSYCSVSVLYLILFIFHCVMLLLLLSCCCVLFVGPYIVACNCPVAILLLRIKSPVTA